MSTAWLVDLAACGVETYVWKPRDSESMMATLAREETAA